MESLDPRCAPTVCGPAFVFAPQVEMLFVHLLFILNSPGFLHQITHLCEQRLSNPNTGCTFRLKRGRVFAPFRSGPTSEKRRATHGPWPSVCPPLVCELLAASNRQKKKKDLFPIKK